MSLLGLLACKPDADPKPKSTDTGPPDVALRADGWLRGDLHFHTNYSDDALAQGGDWMAGALEIADAWHHPDWLAAHPDAPEAYLDYIAVTDHRTTDGLRDPDFGHDHLVVIGGEEFGSNGHAGIWGHEHHIPHDPQGTETADQRITTAVDEAHAAGALFSVNHPMYSGDLWGWTVDSFDAIEVWNGTWSVLAPPSTEADVDDWVAGQGVENPAIRAALAAGGGAQNAQALRFWQSWLSLGYHVPPVGGGDRHMIVPAGLPTTFVQAQSTDEAGVLAGIAAGHTFVSRGPNGPQVLLEATVDGVTHPMGSALPGATEVSVGWTVSGAPGGELRIVTGVVDPSLPEPVVLERIALPSDRESGTLTWSPPASGGWLHAVVVEPLPSDVPAEHQGTFDALTRFPEDGGVAAMLTGVGPLLDLELLGEPARCDSSAWPDNEWDSWCMPSDTEPLGTVYVTDTLQRLMSTEYADGAPTGRSMGAISAAFHTAPMR